MLDYTTTASRPDRKVENSTTASSEVVTRKMTPEDYAKFDELEPLLDRDGQIQKAPIRIQMGAERQKALEKLKEEREDKQ